MEESFASRFKKAWNIFFNRSPTEYDSSIGPSYSYPPDRTWFNPGNRRTIVNAIINRMSVDAASMPLHHVLLDDEGDFSDIIDSELDKRLTISANIDQTGRAFVLDCVTTMLDNGHVAIVAVDWDKNPKNSNPDILSLRSGQVVQWYPRHVTVELYNDRTGQHDRITLPKERVAIAQNPFYSVMNEQDSTLRRLIRKLDLLDAIDEQSSSGKLDLIFQLPYAIKSAARKEEAANRRAELESQLKNSKYGIAYIDGTEHITQLNRPAENNLMSQISYLTDLLMSQLSITQEIMNGSANAEAMTNYNTRTIEPMLAAITDAMRVAYLPATANETIMAFRDYFKMVPIGQLAEIGDKMTRNEIMTSNEIRKKMGLKPSDDPRANELSNKNMPQQQEAPQAAAGESLTPEAEGIAPANEEEIQNGL